MRPYPPVTSSSAAASRSPARGESASTGRRVIDLRLPNAPRDVVLRPRLFQLLDEGAANRPLTLASAPPGSGKTVLLTSWLRGCEPAGRLAWLGLRQSERTPFWSQVLDAIRPSIDEDTLLHGLSAPRDDGSPAFIDRLVGSIAELDEPLVLVIDDLHVASTTAIGALDRVLRAAPPPLRIVAASRIDPALPLHVLRLTSDLVEVRASDLAFDDEEARELFTRMGLELDERDVDGVVRRTEGWAAGLRLLGISLQARRSEREVVERLAVDERPIAEYLSAEVLSSQPPDIRAFLLRTSIVDSLDGDLAGVLSQRDDGERVLEDLCRKNVFIERVPGEAHLYRYHQLFGELLRAEARYELGDELAELHDRAAVWLARRGRSVEAVQHAIDAERWDHVAALLADHWSDMLATGEGGRPAELLAAVPPEHAAASAVVAAYSSLLRAASGEGRRAAALLADAEERRDEVPAVARPGFEALTRYASALVARGRGNLERAAELAALQIERAPVEAASAADEDRRRSLGLATLGAAQLWAGATNEAQGSLEEAVELARESGIPLAELDGLAHLAWLELDAGRLRRAGRLGRNALELEGVGGWRGLPSEIVAHVVLGVVQHRWGDLETAHAEIAAADAIARSTGDVPGRILVAVAAAAVAISDGGDAADDALLRLRAVRRRLPASLGAAVGAVMTALELRLLAKTARLDEAAAAVPESDGDPEVAVAVARVKLALGSPLEALAALELRRAATPYVEIEAQVTEAVAWRAAGGEEQAVAALSAALALAEPEAVRRPFMDAGAAIRDLLGEHLRHTNAHRWLATELVAFLDGRNSAESTAPAELVEPLSERESEVLHYLPTIMSNADIAAELFVSVNTVKTHVKSIYRKFGATRRQDAVRRARQLRLL